MDPQETGTASCGAPDIALPLVGGGSVNPAGFKGQKLVLFCCPAGDAAACAHEVEAWSALADAFERAGVWVVGMVNDEAEAPPGHRGSAPSVHIARDSGGCRAALLRRGLPDAAETDPAAFLFDRDGRLRGAWAGAGHAAAALEAAAERP